MTAIKRNINLDFLRGTAVLLVMTGHFFKGYISTHISWSGVDLFFVLSGFFISGILFREFLGSGRIRSGRFFIRRALKIWPLFYTAVLIQGLYFIFKNQTPDNLKILNEVFFIQNYYQGFLSITWSIGVEEQFYLLMALIFPFFLKYFRTTRKFVFLLFAIMLLCFSLRIITAYRFFWFDAYKHIFPTHLRADSLCAGILISYFYHFKKELFRNWVNNYRYILYWLCIIFLFPLFFFSFRDVFTYTIGFTTTYLGYSILVILCIFSTGNSFFYKKLKEIRVLPIIAWIGFYSYAIYLFHYFIGIGVANNFSEQTGIHMNSALGFIIYLLSNIVFGYLISKVIEQPVLRLREKLYPSYNQ